MLKYIGYSVGTGNSGITTKEGAHSWAQKLLHSGPKAPDKVYIAEVKEVVERPEPTTVIREFIPDEPMPKTVEVSQFSGSFARKSA